MGSHDQDSRPQIKIDISPELYQRIEIAAAQNNLLIKEYIEKLLERIMLHEASIAQQERAPMTREALKAYFNYESSSRKIIPGKCLMILQRSSDKCAKNALNGKLPWVRKLNDYQASS